MRKFITVFWVVMLGMVFMPSAFASDKADSIYGSKIDQAIAFYKGRLYLIDSEYKILSDIGKDARKKINYLNKNRQKVVWEMRHQNVGFSSVQMGCYLNGKLRSDVAGLAYTKP